MSVMAKARAIAYTNEQIINAATGRWGDVAHEVKPAEPYQIAVPDADPIVVSPMTRKRRRALKAAQAAYLMVGAQLADAQRNNETDQNVIGRIEKLMDESDAAYNKALFGDAYDAVMEFYDDLDEVFWDAMYVDIHNALVNRVDLPEDVCSKCGQKIETDSDGADDEGKDESSSTSSTDTGTK